MTQNKMITYYENKLSTVKAMWGAPHLGERGQEYIAFAQGELDAARDGGIDGLKRYWEAANAA